MISENDRKFRNSVEDCSWSGDFGHAEHIRLAWIYLRDLPTEAAISRCSQALRRLAESHGDFEKYHETLTVALLHLISGVIAAGPKNEPWEDFQARAQPFFIAGREQIAKHYSDERLQQAEAKSSFLPPDRDPF